jgi:hypothetical protein
VASGNVNTFVDPALASAALTSMRIFSLAAAFDRAGREALLV